MKKVIWITGASSGIGKALALKFASKGVLFLELSSSFLDIANKLKECKKKRKDI